MDQRKQVTKLKPQPVRIGGSTDWYHHWYEVEVSAFGDLPSEDGHYLWAVMFSVYHFSREVTGLAIGELKYTVGDQVLELTGIFTVTDNVVITETYDTTVLVDPKSIFYGFHKIEPVVTH